MLANHTLSRSFTSTSIPDPLRPASPVHSRFEGVASLHSGVEVRLCGDVRSRRKRHPAPAYRQKLAARIRRHQQRADPTLEACAAGPSTAVGAEPSLLSCAAACWNAVVARVGSVIDSVVQVMPTFGPAIAVAASVPDAPPAEADQILVSHFDFRGLAASDEAATHRDLVPVLRRFFNVTDVAVSSPPTQISVMPRSGDGVPYLRNVAASTPDGHMLLSGTVPPHYMPLLDGLAQFLQRRHIAYRMTDYSVNLANVDHLPEADLLLLADTPPHVVLGPEERADLARRFGHPAHVIHLELAERRNAWGAELCYDLDLAFHATLNARGEPVALVHLPCIRMHPAGTAMGRDEVMARLTGLGFQVVEVDEADQRALATNVLGDGRGRLLMSGPVGSLSPSLISRLAQAGITPVFPEGLWLGHPARDHIPPYGLHCLTAHLRLPRPSRQALHTDL